MIARATVLAILLCATTTHAQWENLNPGAGGQVQGVSGDANTLRARTAGPVLFHTADGTTSMYVYDAAGYKNYIVQGQADNGLLESYNGGRSWGQKVLPAGQNGDAVEVVKIGDSPPIVLAATAFGYSGGPMTSAGGLWFKTLKDPAAPTDPWRPIADGQDPARRHGLPLARIHAIHADPHHPERVYCGTYGGLYLVEDLRTLLDLDPRAGGKFRAIGGSAPAGPGNTPVRRVLTDPADSNFIYVRAQNGTWRGRRDVRGNYAWAKIHPSGDSGNGLGDLTVWRHGAVTCVLLANTLKNKKPRGGDMELVLSRDGGLAWRTVLTVPQALAVRPAGAWFKPDEMEIHFGGPVGYQNHIYCSVHSRECHKAVGFLRGTLSDDGTVTWEDWTGQGAGEFLFPVSRGGRVWADETGKTCVYQSTMGAGLWRRAVVAEAAP
jgi:hypothetical protein